ISTSAKQRPRRVTSMPTAPTTPVASAVNVTSPMATWATALRVDVSNKDLGPRSNIDLGPCGNRDLGPCGNRDLGPCGNRDLGPCVNRDLGPRSNRDLVSLRTISYDEETAIKLFVR
ncbi:hypothetical protein ElyMa_004432300, partial [Elysia marginata]